MPAGSLAASAVAQYAEEGWLVVNDVLPLDEVEQLHSILGGGGPDGGACHGINLTLKHPAFLRLARDCRITDIVASLIGEDIVLQHSKTVQKSTSDEELPAGGLVRFHQDFACESSQ
jgi:hypothetical protein